MKRAALGLITAIALVGAAAPARAEIAFFSNGHNMSIKSHRVEGDTLVLALRGGGEMMVDSALITRIEPDEVPYPDPELAREETVRFDRRDARKEYAAIIDRVAQEQGVDARLVRAVIQVESGYQQTARSRKGAMGLMQLMPQTARQYAVADPYDPVANIEGGIKHLKMLLDRWPTQLALAAYNAGEGAVEKFRGIPPYPETRAYVSRVLQLVSR
jgi:soluble lytic murein transglycosylase-like protein